MTQSTEETIKQSLYNWQPNALFADASSHALIENGSIVHYGDAKAELLAAINANTLVDLSHLGLLELNGADAVDFLQGQVTNDIKLLLGNNAHYTGYCTPKGRLLALFLAFFHYDHLHLQFNRELVEPIMKRLKMFVLRSKVEIKDVSESIVKFGINGPDSVALLTPLFARLPTENFELISLDNGAVLKLPTIKGHSRFQLFTDNTQAAILFNTLKSSCQFAGKPCWDWLDVQMGIPDISSKTQEQFVPQMLNLDILGAINFKKGCYTGQEIVARTHYLGTVKRRTYLAEIVTKQAPQSGDKVLDTTENEVGQIVRVAPNAVDSFDALIELRIEAKEVGNLTCNEAVIRLKVLPYTV